LCSDREVALAALITHIASTSGTRIAAVLASRRAGDPSRAVSGLIECQRARSPAKF
jgi:hypothetical protein